jgi:TPR repeat protein
VVMRGTNKGDQKHARSVLQGACDGGDGGGCFELAAAMDAGKGGKKDAKGAAAMRKKACDAGYKEACG